MAVILEIVSEKETLATEMRAKSILHFSLSV